jgi:hypothetical protein
MADQEFVHASVPTAFVHTEVESGTLWKFFGDCGTNVVGWTVKPDC